MRLQPLVEVSHAHTGVDDGHHDQDESDDGEEREGSSSREIFFEPEGLVHPDELE